MSSTPSWLVPAQPGSISNAAPPPGQGNSLGNMGTALSVRYADDMGAPAAVRYWLTQTKLRGATVNPTVTYDSGWGDPGVAALGATSPLPAPAVLSSRGAVYADSVGRVYLLDTSSANVWSAPVSGTSVGSWRAETPPPVGWTMTGDPVIINNWIYALNVPSGIVCAPLNSDGTLGAWQFNGVTPNVTPAPTLGSSMAGIDRGDGSGGGLAVCYGGTTSLWTWPVDASGAVGAGVLETLLPVTWNYGAIYLDTSYWPNRPVGYVYIIPGGGPTNAYYTSFDLTKFGAGAVGSWVAAPAIPTSLQKFGFAGPPQTPGRPGSRLNALIETDDFYLLGGKASPYGPPDDAIYHSTFNAAWGSITPSTGWTPAWGAAACSWPMPGAATGVPAFVIGQFGGYSDAGGSPILAVQTMFVGQLSNGPLAAPTPTVVSGAGSALPSATQQADGGWLYRWTPPLANLVAWGGPYDGDEYTVGVQFVSAATGDPSDPGLTTIRYAKPPSIAAVTPSGILDSGNPTIGWAYRAGAFGGRMLNWRVQLYAGSTLVADSGVTAGPTLWTPGPAPRLLPGVEHTVVVTVTSTDTSLSSADTVTATYTGTFTPMYIPPLRPQTVTVVPDVLHGALVLNWTNPQSLIANRIYYRRTAPPPSGYAAVVLARSGLVSYWRLDDTYSAAIEDSGPQDSIGAGSGSLDLEQPGLLPLDPDTAIRFAASGQIAAAQPALGNAWTWECLFSADPSMPSAYHWLLSWGGGGLGLYLNPAWQLIFTPGTSTTGAARAYNDGLTHHAAVTWDGTTLSVYADGVLAGSSTSPVPSANLNLAAGSIDIGGSSASWQGLIDEVATYSRALSALEIAADYANLQAPPSAPGDPLWNLLVDTFQSNAGSQSMTLLDQLALTASYDLAVTAIDITGSNESALSEGLVNGDLSLPGPPLGSAPTALPIFTADFNS